ncbi:MAG TPA: SulP family inorganic anion transporter [Acidimicrobiales bacterium]|nr:SulP family inorganic anion transporter [Acidimicrobiales bacterium]
MDRPDEDRARHQSLPVFGSLRPYQRVWLSADVMAGLTLLVIALPEQLATSRLAGMPPITGLYAFVAGTVVFAALGSNPRMSVGADSTIAPLFAVGIAHLAPTAGPRYAALVGMLAVTVGAIVALVGLLKLGWLSEFLSMPIITGFLAGVAVIIAVHQLPDLLGTGAAGGSNLHRISVLAHHLGSTNGWDVGIGLAVMSLVIGAERIDRRVPGALIGLIGSAVFVAAAHLRRHGVAVLGPFAHQAPRWGLSGLSWTNESRILPLAGVVALVVVTQSAATTRAFPAGGGGEADVSRDFVGVGAGSVLAGLIGAFPVNASPPRTAAVVQARGRTQLSGLLAAAVVVAVVPAAGLLQDVPLATLAAVLLSVAARLFNVGELRAIARFDRFEAVLAGLTLLTVALAGVEQGIGLAVALAILDRTRLSARPQMHVLGRVPGTTSWVPLGTEENPQQVPGLLVVLFATPLWYANATHFRAQMQEKVRGAPGPLRAVVLDCVGMADIDYTGSRALGRVMDELDSGHIDFALARAGDHVRAGLTRGSLLGRIGSDRLFSTVGEAVDAFEAPGA